MSYINYFIYELINRLARDLILVLSLFLPIALGSGINFCVIIIGAISSQIALVMILNLDLNLLSLILLASLIACVLSLIASLILNKVKNKEMLVSLIIGFLLSGLYQLFFLYLTGDKAKHKFILLDIKKKSLILSSGRGVKNNISLDKFYRVLDKILELKIKIYKLNFRVPIITFLIIALIILSLSLIKNKSLFYKLIRAINQSEQASRFFKIKINLIKSLTLIISCLLASLGQIIYLQNIGILNTYSSFEKTNLYSIACVLISNINSKNLSLLKILKGTLLFHVLSILILTLTQNLYALTQFSEHIRFLSLYLIIIYFFILNQD